MVTLISLEESYNLNHQSLKSTAKMRLTDSLKASCFVLAPSPNVAGIELEGKKWSVAHHAATRDSFFKIKRSLSANTKMTLLQYIPNNKWFLAPNPAIKIVQTGLGKLGKHSVVEAGWDTLSRSGSSGIKLYSGDDKNYKIEGVMHSHRGAVGTVRAKLRQGVVHSVAASVGTLVGPKLTLKSRIGNANKVKTTYDAAVNVVKVHAKHMGAATESGPRPQALLDVVMPLGKGGQKPLVTIGMKWHF